MRDVVCAALDVLKVKAWVFEKDAGARPDSIQATFLEEVEKADVYLGLFWRGYGEYTIDEYQHAQRLGKPCLVYEKQSGIEDRDEALQTFLDEVSQVETGRTVRWFNTPAELGTFVP